MTTNNFDADVAIVGYGPSGVIAASRLAAQGISVVVFEREKDIYARARAVTVNDWTCRYFQAMGLDHEVKQTMEETFQLRWLTYDGIELNRIAFPPSDMGHARGYSIYQPALEQVLRDGALRFEDNLDLHFGAEVTDIKQDDDGAIVTAIDLHSNKTQSVRVKYVLGCHGGNNKTREMLGVELLGDTREIRWIVIDARVKRWWPNRNILTFWSDKKRPVVDIALGLGNHRWELPLEAHETDDDFQTEEQVWELLEPLGVAKEDVELHQHAFYNHHVRHAENWRLGRVLLLGDACHLMPPWAGAGMQSGIRDAFCLAWRLAYVLQGKLPDSVLESYQVERAPDVARWTETAVALGRIIQQQLSEEEVQQLQKDMNDTSTLPPLLQPPIIASGWLSGNTDETSAIGKLIPQPRTASSNGRYSRLDDLLGDDMVILGDHINPETLLTSKQKSDWDTLGTRYIRVHAHDQASEKDTDIVDLEGTLISWMRRFGVKAIAVRPDRFVAASDVYGLTMPI